VQEIFLVFPDNFSGSAGSTIFPAWAERIEKGSSHLFFKHFVSPTDVKKAKEWLEAVLEYLLVSETRRFAAKTSENMSGTISQTRLFFGP
jgi:pyrroline-5-carboxylate reductase